MIPTTRHRRTSASHRFARAAAVLLTLAAAGCVPEEEPPPAAARPALRAVAEPDLTRLEPAVGEQLARMRATVTALATQPGVDDPRLGEGWGELGRLYQAYELYAPARDAYANAETLDPEDPRWPHFRGHVERALGDAQAAADAFARALARAPDDVPSRVALAQVERALLRPDDAERDARRALATDPRAAGALRLLAQLAADRGDAQATAERYEALLALQPGATKLHQPLAMAYRQLGRVADAERHLRLAGDGTVVAGDPLLADLEALRSGAWADLGAGEAAFRQGDFPAAVAAFRRAAEAQPANALVWTNLGSALFRSGDADGAVAAYRQALERDPANAAARFNLGTVLARRGDDAAAIEQYGAALAADPGYADARFNLANALRRRGDHEGAAAHYRRLVEDDPGSGPARLGEAVCLIAAGRHADARQRLKEALQALPQSITLADAGARLLAASPDAAVRDGRQALELAQKLVAVERNPRHLETLAMALAETGEMKGAVEVQRAALAGAESAGRIDDLERLRANLERYRKGEPCRDPAIG
jgi:tetratricopeptide (TPR) repeat protein